MQTPHTRLKTIAILTFLGMPSYILCFFLHICMAGHMQHGPYPWYHWVNDCLWMICYASVFAFSITLKAKGKTYFIICSFLLIVFRIPLSSGGGSTVIFELLLLIIMGILASRYLRNPGQHLNQPHDDTQFQTSTTQEDSE